MEDQNLEPVQKSSNNHFIVIGGLLLAGLVGFFVLNKNLIPPKNTSVKNTQEKNQSTPTLGPIKEFTIEGKNYEFTPSSISVNKGDTVKITFKDNAGRHNLVVDGYDISTDVLDPGTSEIFTFVADKTGNFEIYCSVGQHKDLGMVGTLVVN